MVVVLSGSGFYYLSRTIPIRFPAVKQGSIQKYEAEKSTCLNEQKASGGTVSISQRSEELRLYNLV